MSIARWNPKAVCGRGCAHGKTLTGRTGIVFEAATRDEEATTLIRASWITPPNSWGRVTSGFRIWVKSSPCLRGWFPALKSRQRRLLLAGPVPPTWERPRARAGLEDARPPVLVGKPIIGGTRLSVEFLLGLMAEDLTEKQILESYPQLCPVALQAMFAFAAECTRDQLVYGIGGAAV